MGQRRASGTDSISQIRPGYWFVRIELGKDIDGKRIRKTAKIKGAERDALKKAREMHMESDAGALLTHQKTVAEYFTQVWLPQYEGAEGSVAFHARQIRNHIQADPIGQVHLTKLRPLDLDMWFNRRRDLGLAESSLANIRKTMNQGLNQAVAWELIAKNPVAGMARKPHIEERPKRPFTAEEIRALLSAFLDHRFGTGYFLHLTRGLRPSEILTLTVGDVDFERGGVSLENRRLKTRKSARFVKCSPLQMDWLRMHIEKMFAGVIPLRRESQPLFPSPVPGRRGTAVGMSTFQHDFNELRENLGLAHCRLYDLRGAGLRALRDVTDVLTLKELARHSNIRMTEMYYLDDDLVSQERALTAAFDPFLTPLRREAKG